MNIQYYLNNVINIKDNYNNKQEKNKSNKNNINKQKNKHKLNG